ncbi:helix-turn-helix transcriptional regulator [Comamonas odontotermitis]|uniref:helix-turn-helix transcriptional regulator n=1 Tax=Comamonas odontotermitis TaxID=379895 RepID=UPI003752D49A
MTFVTITPAYLNRENAAAYLAIGVDTFNDLLKQDKTFPQPRSLSVRRVGWLVEELYEWASKRPKADNLPPPNTGHKNRARGPRSQPAPHSES